MPRGVTAPRVIACSCCGQPLVVRNCRTHAHPGCYDAKLRRDRATWKRTNRPKSVAGLDLTYAFITDDVSRLMASAYRDAMRRDPCAYCGCDSGELDHVDPIRREHGRRSKRSVDIIDWTNLTGSCAACNSAKHAMPLLAALVVLPLRRIIRPLALIEQEWSGRHRGHVAQIERAVKRDNRRAA